MHFAMCKAKWYILIGLAFYYLSRSFSLHFQLCRSERDEKTCSRVFQCIAEAHQHRWRWKTVYIAMELWKLFFIAPLFRRFLLLHFQFRMNRYIKKCSCCALSARYSIRRCNGIITEHLHTHTHEMHTRHKNQTVICKYDRNNLFTLMKRNRIIINEGRETYTHTTTSARAKQNRHSTTNI